MNVTIPNNLGGRMTRMTKLAVKVSELSTHKDHAHGAVMFKGGSVISIAANASGYSQFGGMQRRDHLHASMHAEIATLTGLPKGTTEGASILVVRVSSRNVLANSAPCDMCIACMKIAGIKRVFFSNQDGTIDEIRL